MLQDAFVTPAGKMVSRKVNAVPYGRRKDPPLRHLLESHYHTSGEYALSRILICDCLVSGIGKQTEKIWIEVMEHYTGSSQASPFVLSLGTSPCVRMRDTELKREKLGEETPSYQRLRAELDKLLGII